MRQIKINSTIGTEIISLADVKNYVRIDTSADDDLITDMIIQARIFCENYISRDIVSKNRTYYLPKSSGLFDLPFAPITSVSSVTAEGVAVTFQELGLDDLSIQLDGGPALEVKATYVTTGINDGLIKQALLQFVSTLYDNRADYVTGTIVSGVKTDVKSLLTSYKMMFI
jgi:uncharacterized phage protein (predicted DNA packaging)